MICFLCLLFVLFLILVVLLCFFFWGGEGCVLLRLVVESVMLLGCDVDVFRSRGRFFCVIFMLVCLRSFLSVFKFDLMVLLWFCGREYDFWLCDDWFWLICIVGIWGYVWFFIKFWVLRWLKVIRVLLVDKLCRFWFELFFFMLLILDFEMVFGEVIWCICVVVLVFFGVIWFVELSWVFELNVVCLYLDILVFRWVICGVKIMIDMS